MKRFLALLLVGMMGVVCSGSLWAADDKKKQEVQETKSDAPAVTVTDGSEAPKLPEIPGRVTIPGPPELPKAPSVPRPPVVPGRTNNASGFQGTPQVPQIPGPPKVPGPPELPSAPKIPRPGDFKKPEGGSKSGAVAADIKAVPEKTEKPAAKKAENAKPSENKLVQAMKAVAGKAEEVKKTDRKS